MVNPESSIAPSPRGSHTDARAVACRVPTPQHRLVHNPHLIFPKLHDSHDNEEGEELEEYTAETA